MKNQDKNFLDDNPQMINVLITCQNFVEEKGEEQEGEEESNIEKENNEYFF